MREIKFRAWDKDGNQMISWRELLISNGSWFKSLWKDRDEFVLMQFTGMKDKKGKEIYEDDVIKRVGAYQVVYSNGSYECVGGKSGLSRFPLSRYISDENEIEVIGNIYENPELLKEA